MPQGLSSLQSKTLLELSDSQNLYPEKLASSGICVNVELQPGLGFLFCSLVMLEILLPRLKWAAQRAWPQHKNSGGMGEHVESPYNTAVSADAAQPGQRFGGVFQRASLAYKKKEPTALHCAFKSIEAFVVSLLFCLIP